MKFKDPFTHTKCEDSRKFNTGSRRDSDLGKSPMSKLMWQALKYLALIHKYGDSHYGMGNWRKGQPYSSPSDSMLRHYEAFSQGEDYDIDWVDDQGIEHKGSGLLHSAHMAWNALFILHMQLHPKQYATCDDRLDAFGVWVNETFAQTELAKELEKGSRG
jgi:hypothetical protein